MISNIFDQKDDAQLPDKIDTDGLLVGWSQELSGKKQPIGFNYGNAELSPENGWVDPIMLAREGHLVTIAPTGSGKGRGCVIPALLRHNGPVIVIDPKGENAAVTARHREEMGQEIIVIDPMNITGLETASFNPLDLIDIDNADAIDISSMFASNLILPYDDTRNMYWYQRAQHLLTGLILHVKSTFLPEKQTFKQMREILGELYIAQDAMQNPLEPEPMEIRNELINSRHPEARSIFEQILHGPRNESVGSVLAMTSDGVDFLKGENVEKSVAKSTFDLDKIVRGDPVTIYLVLPPHMLESHGRLLKLWISSLISLITRRRTMPKKSTLFLLDEAAQLGALPQLRQAMTLLRGYGVQTWSFWQDVSQIKRLYPLDYETMINNCAVVQCFGALNRMGAMGMSELTGYYDSEEILDLDAHEMILQIGGNRPVIARLPDYLNDPVFAGKFESNPFHDNENEILPKPQRRVKLREPEAKLKDYDVSIAPPPSRNKRRKSEPQITLAARLTDQKLFEKLKDLFEEDDLKH